MNNDAVSSPSAEQFKAEQEKWKALQKVIPITESAGQFIGKVVGPFTDELGGLLGDQMKAWRAANLDRLAQKWEKIREERGLNESVAKTLPFGDAYRTIDSVSKEDDPDIQDLWAQIICNATDTRSDVSMKRMYIDLLEKLSGIEAKILTYMFDRYDDEKFYVSPDSNSEKNKYVFEKIDAEEIRLSLQNLHRLGILTPNVTEHEIFDTNTHEEWIRSVDNKNYIEKITSAISNIVLEFTHFSGSPLNDIAIGPEHKQGLLEGYDLTRIGWDLFHACVEKRED